MSTMKELVEKIESFIPGIKEYKEKELLREESLRVHQYVRNRISEMINTLREVEKSIVLTNPSANIMPMEQVSQMLETLLRYVESFQLGYSGWLDSVNVEQEELVKVLELDYNLLNMVEGLRKAVDELTSVAGVDDSKTQAKVRELISGIDKMKVILKERDSILKKVGGDNDG